MTSECPVRPPRPAVSNINVHPRITSLLHIPVSMMFHHYISAKALIDSGSAENFISRDFINCFQIPKIPCQTELNVHSILGKPLGKGCIYHCTASLKLCIGVTHSESISLLVLNGSMANIILGCPWLQQHAPNVSWTTGDILSWSEEFFDSCLKLLSESNQQLILPMCSYKQPPLSRETPPGQDS